MEQEQAPTITSGKNRISDYIIKGKITTKDLYPYKSIKQNALAQECYIDDEFKPCETSLSHNIKQFKKGKNCEWKRATELIQGEVQVFYQDIEPTDIQQGQLGDCYFLSTLSVLAEKKGMIQRLFVTQKNRQNGLYCVWICHDGEWRQVCVDDYFPCKKGSKNPIYSKANGSELWVLLLEKAYAKVYGSYEKIELGWSGNAFRDLTGAPGQQFDINSQDAEGIFKIISENLQKGYVVTTSSSKSDQGLESENDAGIISSHCYGILDARVVEKGNKKYQLLQMRNPWGHKEWTGAWSDKSNEWTSELREQLKVEDKDDGIFWISAVDFAKQYQQVTVGKLHAEYYYSNYGFHSVAANEQTTVKVVRVRNKVVNNHCFISLSQVDKRNYLKENGVEYNYSPAHMIVTKYDPKTKHPCRFEGAVFDANRDMDVELTLSEEGDYLVYLEIDWTQHIAKDFVVSAYSKSPLDLIEFKNSPLSPSQVLAESFKLHGQANEKDIKVQQFKEGAQRMEASIGGYVYFYYQNPTSKVLNEEVTLKKRNGLSIQKPYLNEETNQVSIKEKSEGFLYYKCMQTAYSFGFSTKFWFSQETDNTSLIELCLKSAQKVKQRQLNAKDIEVKVYTTKIDGGHCMLYVNETNKKYVQSILIIKHSTSEDLKFVKLDNLKVDDPKFKDDSLQVIVKPNDKKLVVLKVVDPKLGNSYSTSYTFKLE